jgi:hypothetical protein
MCIDAGLGYRTGVHFITEIVAGTARFFLLIEAKGRVRLLARQIKILFLIRGDTRVFLWRANLAILFSVSLIAAPAFATNVHRSPTAGTPATHKARKPKHRAPKVRGQQSIDPERVTQIQLALIREHYLTGEATGNWDTTTVAAMQKFQADQGWQTKLMPDSRALMKLGLGPDYSNAINAKNSSFAAPQPSGGAAEVQTAGFAAAAGVAQ